MIATLNANYAAPAPVRSAAPAPPAAPTAGPKGDEPLPDIDFSCIQTPEKAVLLPCLNAAVLGVAVAGLVSSSMTNSPTSAGLQLAFNCTQGSLSYQFNANDETTPVTASGTLGGVPYQETWTADPRNRRVTVHATLGDTPIDIEFAAGKTAALAKGTIGSLPVLQIIAREQNFEGVNSNGKLAGQSLHQTLRLDESDNRWTLLAQGALGDKSLAQEVTLASPETGGEVSAHGNLAGVEFNMKGQLTVTPPQS